MKCLVFMSLGFYLCIMFHVKNYTDDEIFDHLEESLKLRYVIEHYCAMDRDKLFGNEFQSD